MSSSRAAKRARTAAAAEPPRFTVSGGHTFPDRVVAKYRERTMCDAVIRTACGTSVHAHRLVLTSGSDYLESLWAGAGWADATGPLDLADISGATLQTVMDFLYEGHAAVADEAALCAVIEAAAYLQVTTLRDSAVKALVASLDASSCMHAWTLGDRLDLTALSEAAALSACTHFSTVCASEAWLETPLEVVRALLADDRLEVSDEALVYHAGVAWLRARQPPFTDDAVAALLSLVRYPQLSRAFVKEVVHEEPLLASVPGMKMVARAREQFSGQQSTVRLGLGAKALYALGGYDDDDTNFAAVERFDPATNAWSPAASMLTARNALGAAVLQGKLYVVGGEGDDNCLQTVERFDPTTNAWEAVASMLTVRCAHGVAALQGQLYAVGGFNGSYVSTVERYNPSTNAWEAVASMSTARGVFGISALDGKLYAVGGYDGNDRLATVERFDPATNAWEAVPPMSTARAGHGVAALDGKLYAVGGFDGSDDLATVERYDPVTNAWEVVASVSKSLSTLGLTALQGKLYAVGGYSGGSPKATVERFDPATNTWEVIAPMAEARDGFALAAL